MKIDTVIVDERMLMLSEFCIAAHFCNVTLLHVSLRNLLVDHSKDTMSGKDTLL